MTAVQHERMAAEHGWRAAADLQHLDRAMRAAAEHGAQPLSELALRQLAMLAWAEAKLAWHYALLATGGAETRRLVPVCAWCPDWQERTADARAAGFDVTHVMCPACRVKWGEGEADTETHEEFRPELEPEKEEGC